MVLLVPLLWLLVVAAVPDGVLLLLLPFPALLLLVSPARLWLQVLPERVDNGLGVH